MCDRKAGFFRDGLFCLSELVLGFGIFDFVYPEALLLLDSLFDAVQLH